MANDATGGIGVLAAFFDDGAYAPLFAEEQSAVSVAYGFAGAQPVYVIRQNGEALSPHHVDICCKTLALAAKTGNPVVTFYNSKGSTLQDGQKTLAAAARLSAAAANLSGVVPQIAVVTGTCGASAALAAAQADLCIVSKSAEFFLTAPELSANEGDEVSAAGSAEYAAKAGIAALVCETPEEAAAAAAKLIALLPSNNLSEAASFEYAEPAAALDLTNYAAPEAVASVVDYGSDVEVFAGFGSGISTYLATLCGSAVGVVATNGPEKYFGRNCANKAARFVRLCDAFGLPVLTFVNSAGFVRSNSEEAAGGLRAAARLAATYADATTAKVAIIAGRAVGTTYTALANADLTIALNSAVISPLEPAATVTILQRDEINASGNPIAQETAARAKAYEQGPAGAASAMENGLADFVATPQTLRSVVAGSLDILVSKQDRRLPKKHGNMPL